MTSLLNSFSSSLPSLQNLTPAEIQLRNDAAALDAGRATNAANMEQRLANLKPTNFAVAPTGQVLNEGYSRVQGDMSEAGSNFRSLAAGQPSFASMGSIKGALGKLTAQAPTPGLAVPAANIIAPSASATSIRASSSADTDSNTDHKVSLTASVSDGESDVIQANVNFPHEPLLQRRVEFDAMPEVSEVHTAEYEPLSAPQMPGEFQKYKGTKSTQWTIIGTFVCRTRAEAKRNFINMNTLRSWVKPYFGEKQRLQFSGKLGAPPPVITFAGWRGLVGSVPTVLVSLNWTWPKDVDWIPTGVFDEAGAEIPFPTVMIVTINLVESFSPQQFNGFDLVAFRNGNMLGAWSGLTNTNDEEVNRAEATGGQQIVQNGTVTAAPSDIAPRAIILGAKVPQATILGSREVTVGGPILQPDITSSPIPPAIILAPRAEATAVIPVPATIATPRQLSMNEINQGIAASQSTINNSFAVLGDSPSASTKSIHEAIINANTKKIEELQAQKNSGSAR